MNRLLALFLLSIVGATGAKGQAAQPQAKPNAIESTPTMTVDQVLEKYVQALGGREAIQRITTRVATGSVVTPATGDTGTVEIYEKAPNKRLMIVKIPGASSTQAFDGKAGWAYDPDSGVHDLEGPDLDQAKRDADFYRDIRLKELYPGLEMKGLGPVDSRQAYMLESKLADGSSEKFFFDSQTGLLARNDAPIEIPDEGKTTQQTTLDDYRPVDDVKVPFLIRQSNPEYELVIKIKDVKQNVPIDDSKFAKPATQP